MNTFSITGKDTLTIWDRVLNDLADDDSSAITFPNDLVTVKTGKEGNTLFANDEQGKNADCILRVVRGSNDDKFLQSKLALWKQNPVGFELASGTFVKKIGDGEANITNDTYILRGGAITRGVDGKENQSGDTEQNVAVYNMKFASAERSLT